MIRPSSTAWVIIACRLAHSAANSSRVTVRGRVVHGGLAYLPMFKRRAVRLPDNADLPRDVRYEHRGYNRDGRKLPVKVVLPR